MADWNYSKDLVFVGFGDGSLGRAPSENQQGATRLVREKRTTVRSVAETDWLGAASDGVEVAAPVVA